MWPSSGFSRRAINLALYNGKNGIDGRNGTNGINGINGINGTNGVDGKDGEDGVDGKDGINGSSETNTVTIGGKIITSLCDNSVTVKLNHSFQGDPGFVMSSIVMSGIAGTCLTGVKTFTLTAYLQIRDASGTCNPSAALDADCLQGVAGKSGKYRFGGVVACTMNLTPGVNVTAANADGDVTATIVSTTPCTATSPDDNWENEVAIDHLYQLSPMDIDGTLGFAIEEAE